MFSRRTIFIALIFTALFSLLGLRLYQLQVWEQARYQEAGRQRTHRLQQTPPGRGRILDRRGRVLAEDRLRFELWLKAAPTSSSSSSSSPKSKSIASRFIEISPEIIAEFKAALAPASAPASAENGDKNSDAISSTALPENLQNRKIAAINYLANHEALSLFANFIRRGNENLQAASRRLAEQVFTALINADGSQDAARVLTDLPFPAAATIWQAQANPYGGNAAQFWEIRTTFSRVYPYRELFGHITGYVGSLSAEEYRELRGYWNEAGEAVQGDGVIRSKNADRQTFFAMASDGDERDIIALREIRREGKTLKTWGDFRNPLVGRSGIEQWYNQELRGEHRWRLEELVRGGHGWRTFIEVGNSQTAKSGGDIKLTIDADFQRQVRDIVSTELRELAKRPEHRAALNRQKLAAFPAAVMVMNAENGEIYALVSLPEYDPNTVRGNYAELAADPSKPLLNRVLAERFPPGSSLKPLVAAAALATGKITGNTRFDCEGVERLGEREFVCMNRAHHGSINVTTALRVSCNIFFYHAGGALGARMLRKKLDEFGIGKLTGIDLPNETPGLLAFAANERDRGLSLGEVWHIAIGQGRVDATLAQMSAAYAMLVNGGKRVRPHLRSAAERADLSRPTGGVAITEKDAAIVQRGMWEAVQGNKYPRGTAYRDGHISGFEYLGKTGSAQGKRPATHAWLIAAAPAKAPEIIVSVLVPFGNHGGNTCAPIVKKIVQTYFHLDEFPREDESDDSEIFGDDDAEFTEGDEDDE